MVAHPLLIWGTVASIVAVVVLSFVPLPNAYNVSVSVNVLEFSAVVATYFSITGVSASAVGQSTVLNWVGLSIAPPALGATYTMTVCVGNSHCTSKSGSQILPSVPVVNGASLTATDQFTVGYVPGGCGQSVSVTLTQSGAGTVATGSASVNVGGGC